MTAYQTAGFAYQGTGLFAYQGDAETVAPPSGGGGGGQSPRRADFGLDGKSTRGEPRKPVVAKKVEREVEDILGKAREQAAEATALRARAEADAQAKRDARRTAKLEAMARAVVELEAHNTLLADDEEVLIIFAQIVANS